MIIKRFPVALWIAVAFLLVTELKSAHHGNAGFYGGKTITVTGTITRVEIVNPHSVVYIDVKDDKGQTVEWEVEMMSLNHLRGYGWVRNTVKPGDVISCTGGAAKSGAASMISSYMKLADGRMIKS